MKIKIKSSFSKYNSRYFTSKPVREYLLNNQQEWYEAERHNMNFYKLSETGGLVHVYDIHDVKFDDIIKVESEHRVEYAVEGFYLNKNTNQREWMVWMHCDSLLGAIQTKQHGSKHLSTEKERDGFTKLRVVAINKTIHVMEE